jgi:hypothetical protein
LRGEWQKALVLCKGFLYGINNFAGSIYQAPQESDINPEADVESTVNIYSTRSGFLFVTSVRPLNTGVFRIIKSRNIDRAEYSYVIDKNWPTFAGHEWPLYGYGRMKFGNVPTDGQM